MTERPIWSVVASTTRSKPSNHVGRLPNQMPRTDSVDNEIIVRQIHQLRLENPLVVVLALPPTIGFTLLGGWLFVKSGMKTWSSSIKVCKQRRLIKRLQRGSKQKLRRSKPKLRTSSSTMQAKVNSSTKTLLFGLARSELAAQAKLIAPSAWTSRTKLGVRFSQRNSSSRSKLFAGKRSNKWELTSGQPDRFGYLRRPLGPRTDHASGS